MMSYDSWSHKRQTSVLHQPPPHPDSWSQDNGCQYRTARGTPCCRTTRSTAHPSKVYKYYTEHSTT
eukprot:1871402-Rhodomonas_salina.1